MIDHEAALGMIDHEEEADMAAEQLAERVAVLEAELEAKRSQGAAIAAQLTAAQVDAEAARELAIALAIALATNPEPSHSPQTVAMATNQLSQAIASYQTARLLAAECYRLKSAQSLLGDEHRILSKLTLADVEADCSTSRLYELERVAGEMSVALLRIHELGEEKLGALPQASLSVFGTLTCGERISITLALEPQDFKDGAVLIKEGDPRDAFLTELLVIS